MGATPRMLIGSMVGAVELVLDAEVVELVEHVIGVVRQQAQLEQQLVEGRVVDLPATGVVEHGLRVLQLRHEAIDLGSEILAGRPRLQQAVRDGGERLAHHPPRRAERELHPHESQWLCFHQTNAHRGWHSAGPRAQLWQRFPQK